MERLSGEPLERFRWCFDEEFWSEIPAVDGALQACWDLTTAGYTLICVSAIQPAFEKARLRNLQTFGFLIERVIATSASIGGGQSEGGGDQ